MAKHPKIKVVERKLGKDKALGLFHCDLHLIEIDPRQSHKEYMDTLIHELLHSAMPEASETKVYKTAKQISKVLWEQNFKKVSN